MIVIDGFYIIMWKTIGIVTVLVPLKRICLRIIFSDSPTFGTYPYIVQAIFRYASYYGSTKAVIFRFCSLEVPVYLAFGVKIVDSSEIGSCPDRPLPVA